MPAQSFDDLPAEGEEFAIVMIRRTEFGDGGEVELLGEVPHDLKLVEKAARAVTK